jgi:hypothetical protein
MGKASVSSVLVFAGALAVLLAGCAPVKDRTPPIANDAYIWQRRWNDSVVRALHESASSIRAWRVLAAEVEARGDWLEVGVNRAALRREEKPVIAVIRINHDPGGARLGDSMATRAAAVIGGWEKEGVPVRGIEIDYDCGTASLPHYRDFLHLLRRRMGRERSLSVTALPSWMDSPDLPGLLAEVDEAVLQVHSVMSPQKGLFDPATAYEWVREWSTRSAVPFRVALPTYWSRVTWNEGGQVTAIESEVSRHGVDGESQELFVEPGEVSSFVARLRNNPPPNLKGMAWFRLPTGEDQRAWNARTWHAVMEGRLLPPTVPTIHIKAEYSGVRDVYLENHSDVAGRLPREVSVSARGCEFADALPPYVLVRRKDSLAFRLRSWEVLRAGQEKLVGWVRCTGKELDAHVSF